MSSFEEFRNRREINWWLIVDIDISVYLSDCDIRNISQIFCCLFSSFNKIRVFFIGVINQIHILFIVIDHIIEVPSIYFNNSWMWAFFCYISKVSKHKLLDLMMKLLFESYRVIQNIELSDFWSPVKINSWLRAYF